MTALEEAFIAGPRPRMRTFASVDPAISRRLVTDARVKPGHDVGGWAA
jgi:hypothetical protein